MNFYEDFQSRKKRKQDKDKLYKEVMQYVPDNASMIVRNEVDKAYGDKETYSKPKNLTVKDVPFQSKKSAQRYAEKQIRSGQAVGKLPIANRFDNANRFEKRFDKPTRPTEQTFRPLNPNNVYLNPKITPERMMRYGVRPQPLPINSKPTANSSGGIKGKFQRNVVNPFINSILETRINREWSKEDRRDKDEIAKLEKMKGKFYVPQSKGLFQTAVQDASGLGGQKLDQVRSAIPTALAFAGGALALGQAGPQVALPEEVVTVPSAFTTGLKVGVAKSAYQSEKGASYREQIESGVDPKKASYISTGVGAVNAGLEFIQFDKLLKGFKFAKAVNDLPAMKQIGLEIAKRMGDVAKETGQEVLQEGVSISGANIGKKMSGIELDSKEDVKNRLKDTAVSSALSFGLMGVPGTIGSINNIARTPIQNSTQTNVNPVVERTTQTSIPNEAKKTALDEYNSIPNANTPFDNKLANTPQNLRQNTQLNNQANQTIIEPPEYVAQMKQYQAKEAEFNSLKEDMQNKSIPMKNRKGFKAMYEDDNGKKSYTFDKNFAWVGDKKVNAYVYENPILSGIYYKAMNELELQAEYAIKGKREIWYDQYGDLHYAGSKQKAEADMNYMLHDLGMSYKAIDDGLSRYREFLEVLMSNSDVKVVKEAHDRLINANAKKVELALDNMLMGTMKDRETGNYYEDTLYQELRNIADEGQADEWFTFNQKPPQKPLPQVQNVETYTTKNVDSLSIDEQRVSNFAQRLVKSNIAPKVQFIETNQPGINGYYENGTIFINRNSSNPIMNVFAHEFTHHLQESKMYNDFRNFTINHGLEYAYGHNDIAALIQEKQNQYANAGIELSVTDAENELMAEYVEKYLLSDEEAINELARQNESLFYRIYAHIRDSIKLMTGSEEEQFLIEARRKYAKAIRNLANERTVDLTRYLESDNQSNLRKTFSLDDNFNGTTDSMNPDTRYSLDTSQIKNRSFQNTVRVSPSIRKDFAQSIQNEIDNGTFAYEVIKDKDSLARVNQALERNGLDKYLYNLESKLNEGKHLTKDDMVMGQRLIQEYIKLGDSEKAMQAVTLTAEAGTQAGQMVQAMSMMRKLTPEGQLMALNRITQKLTNEYVKPGEQEITLSKERAKDIMMSDTPERLEQAVERAKENVYNQVPVTMMDKINAWRYLSMLGNPKTHDRNVLGNAVFYPTRMIKNQIARGFESAFIKGEKTKSFLTPKDKGLVELGKYDYSLNESIIKGESKYADSKMMYNRKIFNNKVLESIREFNFEWLEKEDNFFIKNVYANSFAGYLKANGIKLSDVIDFNGKIKNSIEIGNANISNPYGTGILDNARRYATIEAQKATYRDESAVATWLTRQFKANQNDTLSQARNKAVGRFVVEAVIPFKKTPINVLKRGVEYSPIGLMDSLTLGVKQLKAGEITGTDLCDKISAGLTGTTLVGLGYALAHFGFLKGRGNEEKEKEKAFSKLTGEQNYSVNIGNHSYTIDWVSPTALPLFVGVEAFEELNKENDKKGFDIVNSLGTALDVIGNVSDPVFSMSMVQGLTRTMKSYSSNDGGFVFDFLSNAASQYAGQYVPTLFGQFNRTKYETRYDTSSPRKGNAKVMQQTFNQIVSKVPFAPPRVLQPKVDVWGQEMLQEGDVWTKRLVQNMISPGYYSNTKRGTREEEIFRLYKKNGNTNVLPPQIDKVKDVTLNGETYTFNSKQRTQFLKTSGTYRKDLLDSLFSSGSYKKASDEEKEKMIYNVYDYANQKAKSEIAKEFGTSYKPKGWIETADIVGAKDYLQYRGVVGSLPDDEKGKSHKLKALSELGLSDEKTIAILKADFDNKKKSYSALIENGISIDDYLTVEEVRKNMRVPLNRKGNPITKGPYSKKAQTFRYINSLDLEPYQKKMLFEMYYDNKR